MNHSTSSQRRLHVSVLFIALLLVYAGGALAAPQTIADSNPPSKPTSVYGEPHPDAPAELQQFDFLIGDFSRRDRRRNPDGSWQEWVAGEWNARYFMNGFGIIDETLEYETGRVTTNIRIFDPASEQWKVTWLSFPDYGTLTAEGGLETGPEGESIVLVTTESKDRLVFTDITENGYVWTLFITIDGQYVPVREIETTRK